MLRSGRYKNLHYAGGYVSELYDLEADSEEMHNIANDPVYSETLRILERELLMMLDPEGHDESALSDQARLVDQLGGRGAVIDTRRCKQYACSRGKACHH